MRPLSKRKLQKRGPYSLGLVLPTRLLKHYGWREGQFVTVEDAGRGVLRIRDAKSRRRSVLPRRGTAAVLVVHCGR